MELDPIWIGIGTVCFGIVVGYITYRTLVRTEKSAVSDIASVIGAIAGATITGIYSGSAFALYSIGLLLGMTIFLLLRLKFERGGAQILGVPEGATLKSEKKESK
jgi:ABC-type Co2+ transport system permease subunit